MTTHAERSGLGGGGGHGLGGGRAGERAGEGRGSGSSDLPRREERPDDGRVQPSRRATRGLAILAGLFVVGAALIVLSLHVHRVHALKAQRAAVDKERARGIRVSTTDVKTTPIERTVTLPGDVYGYSQATIYAKVSGYIRDVLVQRGQRVKRGDLLATIESPENEKDVATAQHDFAIAKINADRAERLAPSGIVTEQDRDNAVAQQRIARSSLERARAILAYTTVRAPFDGAVTARYVDPGSLVPAATGGTASALPIVDVVDIDTVRIFVYVAQDVAPFVHPGLMVTVWQDELPDRRIDANVSYATGGLDPRTRTMQVEIDLDNRPYGILPGTFAHVDLHLKQPPSPQIPDEAIVIREGKTEACVIDAGKAHYVAVDLGYNDGGNVRVLRGLQGGETIGIDVPVEVQEGQTIQPVPLKPSGK